MRRCLALISLLFIACRAVTSASWLSPAAPSPQVQTPPLQLQPIPSTPSPTPAELPLQNSTPFLVRTHPDGILYAGDQISFEVIPPPGETWGGQKLTVTAHQPEPVLVGSAGFEPHGLGGRLQATLRWAWDTHRLAPGTYLLTFDVEPGGITWTEQITLHPVDQMPRLERNARWATASSQCCTVHYITGTEAERDLPSLLAMIDEQARNASQKLGATLKGPLTIVFLPRVLGHGGFANAELAVSYLDRNYAFSDPAIIVYHEMVHLLDASLGGRYRPPLFVEGLAVYLSGGHFKEEPLLPRAAALLAPQEGCRPATSAQEAIGGPWEGPFCTLGGYLSLAELADRFYLQQHEAGYLQAGALVEFMVKTWGWEKFSQFYRDIPTPPRAPTGANSEQSSDSHLIDQALQVHFHITFGELERQFLEALKNETLSPALILDVQLSIELYNTVRRYQQALDPSAYFLNAWLLDGEEMRHRGIVADYLRKPDAPENQSLETLLVAANQALIAADFERCRALLSAVNAALDVLAYSADFDNLMLTSAGNASPASTSIALIMPEGTGQAACEQYWEASCSVSGVWRRKLISW